MNFFKKVRALFLLLLVASTSFTQSVIINEIMPSNSTGITDEHANTPDWIELYNTTSETVSLKGYTLSDKINKPNLFIFPDDAIISAKGYLNILNGDSIFEAYLAETGFNYSTIIDKGATFKYLLPETEPNEWWKEIQFADTSWLSGISGFGFGDNDDATILPQTTSVYLRKEFFIESVEAVKELLLSIDYDDGFVAYINGIEIVRVGFVNGYTPLFSDFADGHEAVMYNGGMPALFVIPNFAEILVEGKNVLSIQVHNASETSSDLTAIPFLTLGYNEVPKNMPPLSPLLPLKNKQEKNTDKFYFGIDAESDTIYLFKDKILIDKIIINNTPTDISIGRQNSNTDTAYYFSIPTPGSANIEPIFPSITINTPDFSHNGGVYQSSFQLNITTKEFGAVVRYTTNGTDPDENSEIAYYPISISKNMCLKARVFKNGYLPSRVKTESFIFIKGTLKMPVISLTAKHEDFFDYNTGIYELGPNAETEQPNFGANFWQDWERPIHIEMFETDGSTGFSVDAGVKIFGNWSRANPQKSLALFTRSKYGSKIIKHQIFKDKPIKEFENIVLRNSGGDFLNANMRDGMISSLVRNMGIDRQAYRQTKVFLNGEYWGTMALREKINEHFIAANHGLNSFEVQIFEWYGAPIFGSNRAHTHLLSFLIKNNLSDDTNYELIKQKIDIQNFIDYYNAEIYIVNEDWPGNNNRMWTSSRTDAKIRPILFDTDFGFGTWQVDKFNNDMVSFVLAPMSGNYANSPEATFLLRKLMENNSFKNLFLNSAADRLNTTFCTDSVLQHIDSIYNLIATEIESHYKRWNGDMDYFNANIDNIKYFAQQRPEIARTHYETYFNTQGSFNLSLSTSNPNAGRISLNSISLKYFPWVGKYFNDIPITLTAIPAPGYRFMRWEGDVNSTNSTITHTNQSTNVTLHAVFEFDNNLLPDVIITEINYNSNETFDSEDWIEIYNTKSTAQDISGWIIKDSRYYNSFTIPAGTILPAQSYLVLVKDSIRFKLQYPTTTNYKGNMSFSLSNTGETIFLLDSLKNTIDKVEYKTTAPWPLKANGYGYTLQLNSLDADNSLVASWNAAQLHGSPGTSNSIYTIDEANKNIVISEINYNSHENSNCGDWIEIFNKGTSTIDISGWVVKDAQQNIYIVPNNTKIAAGAFLILAQSATQFQLIYPEISTILNMNIGLNSTADEVYLYDKFENLVDFVQFSSSPPWPITANGTGRTIILTDINKDNNKAENWRASELLGNPGAPNTTTGLIKNNSRFSTNVFPTISSNTFTLNSEIECTVYLFSETGVLLDVFECKYEATYNANNLNNGVYFIYFVNDTFVKSHTVLVKK